jgi:hypothetical protein
MSTQPEPCWWMDAGQPVSHLVLYQETGAS